MHCLKAGTANSANIKYNQSGSLDKKLYNLYKVIITMSREIFPESSRLKQIIENHRWTLYEGSQAEKDPPSWEELSERGPATDYQIGKNYLFTPIPENGQSLREAYSITKGFGPSLVIDDPSDDRWITLYVTNFWNGKPIFFSRLFFHKEGAAATSPTTRDNPDPDTIGIDYTHLIDTFDNNFKVVSPEEYGIDTPIPMPFHPEYN